MTSEEILSYMAELWAPILKPELLHKSYYNDLVFYEISGDFVNQQFKPNFVREIIFQNVRIIGYYWKDNVPYTIGNNTYNTTLFAVALEMYNPQRINVNNGQNIFYVFGFYVYQNTLIASKILPKSNNTIYYNSITEVIQYHPDFVNYQIITYEQISIGIE